MCEAAQAPVSASSAPESQQAGKRRATQSFQPGVLAPNCLAYLRSGVVKLAPFFKVGR